MNIPKCFYIFAIRSKYLHSKNKKLNYNNRNVRQNYKKFILNVKSWIQIKRKFRAVIIQVIKEEIICKVPIFLLFDKLYARWRSGLDCVMWGEKTVTSVLLGLYVVSLR